ncbi:MAG: DegT/DnrJ/EryC1/StrS family aminotransferase [Candidatus Eremiobacterota bacterium]
MRVEFFRHALGKRELERVSQALREPILTTGRAVAEFERRLAARLGLGHAVGVTSCTAALHLCLQAHGVGPGDEVITTPLTFVATAHAILHAGATPVFADVEPATGILELARVEAAVTSRTRAVIPVHLYGVMGDMRGLAALAERRCLTVIEDAAQCLEGSRDGVRPGHLSRAACFSFYATKSITSGEGGAVVTHHQDLAARLRRLRLHGMTAGAEERHRHGFRHWDVDEVGWKYNMDNLQAALLLGQLPRVRARYRARQRIWRLYDDAFGGQPGIERLQLPAGARSACHLYTLLVDPERRDRMVAAIESSGVGVTVNYRPVHLLSCYRRTFGFQPGDFPAAESIGERTLSLPLYPGLKQAQVEHVIAVVRRALKA